MENIDEAMNVTIFFLRKNKPKYQIEIDIIRCLIIKF